MLSDDKVQEVRILLLREISQRKTAALTGVHRNTVRKIAAVLHQFPLCHCPQKRHGRSGSLSEHEPDSLRLDLHGGAKKRYEHIRLKVEKEIANGTREPLMYARYEDDGT